MGLLNKIGIEFDPNWTGAGSSDLVDYCEGGESFCSFQFGMAGTSVATGFLAGRFADEVEREGEGAAIEYCQTALRDIFGSDIDRHILKMHETRWRSSKKSLGSYSYQVAGSVSARHILAEPIEDRLFFAGEATVPHAYASVHGAFESGIRAAKGAITAIDGQ